MAADGVAALLRSLRARSGTVRVRTAAGAVGVVGFALIVAAISLVVFLRRSLTADVRVAALLRAEAVADQLAGGLPTAGMRLPRSEDEFLQVLHEGSVVASTSNVRGERPLVRIAPGETARLDVPFDDDPFLAVAASASTPDVSYTVVAGRSLDNVVESSATVVTLLAAGLPVLLLFVAGVTWRVVGRALAPVESIRSDVETISTQDLHRRVTVPGTSDEVARLAATMNQMLKRLEDGQVRQRRFVSDASHELRSPVASIRQHAEVALAHANGTSTSDLAGLVLAEDLRLQHLVEDLLLLARLDEDGDDRRREMVDVDDIVFQEVDRVRRSTNRTIDAGRVSAGRVLGDRKQLARLVGNLLDNAVRHARHGVAVSLFEHGDDVVLRVDDDGLGIPRQQRERVFERFVRLEDARDRSSGGAGLGLAIVAEVAANHGGVATTLESPAGGARLEVRIPRSTE